MILLEFKIDEEELASSLEDDIIDQDEACFISTMFFMPVRFQINGHDLLWYDGLPWATVPIMYLAYNWLHAIQNLPKTIKVKLNFMEEPGSFFMTMIDDEHVKVSFDGTHKLNETIIKYNEILKAFQIFSKKVKDFMKSNVPQMNLHPYWGPWLRGENKN